MRKFQNWWMKFSCFLTGYNFYILSNCSEVSTRKVKKYTAALLIVSTVWAFVGYCFCDRYMKLGPTGSIFGAIISVLIIIQIERQILLADRTNSWLKATRIGLAILMAIIGSLIIDQIIFKDDIDKAKIKSNQEQVEALLPARTKQITEQITQLNASIAIKELERKELLDDISRNPNQQIVETSSSQVPVTKITTDSSKTTTTSTALKTTISRSIKVVPNPKINQLQPIDDQLKVLADQKMIKETMQLGLKTLLEKEVDSKVGFLDELQIMFNILSESFIAAIVYVIWLLFLLLLELLILIGKSNEDDSDYDKTIQKQMAIHFRKIELL
ncbi:DUF4407 domain-containing protein [Pedobacter sp. KBW06]|uniref:DUF4407 domain-containing protein n=1 Tax=Pedobacter sp. KBW06 TaxID=2153359 RepID=UPI000F59C7B7|nr:DUF4407 domain-containing protein [Pedobacter sp. KBW06]RQO65173.1 DUF4407 domain-containing protein [Pedobacter sp. KBW06]